MSGLRTVGLLLIVFYCMQTVRYLFVWSAVRKRHSDTCGFCQLSGVDLALAGLLWPLMLVSPSFLAWILAGPRPK